MTKEERKYYNEYFNKLDESYLRDYCSFNKRIKYVILNKRDLLEIKLDILELFYRNQKNGNKVYDVIGQDKDMFFREIIDSYYENIPRLKLIKEVIKNGLTYSLFLIIVFSLLVNTSGLILLSIPDGIFIAISMYLINRYIDNVNFRNVLNFLVSLIGSFIFVKFIETYKNMYVLSNYTMVFIIMLISTILFFLYKKK